MIRKEAVDDEDFVRDFCKENAISFFVKRVDIPKLAGERKMGTEEAGRYARYNFLMKLWKIRNQIKFQLHIIKMIK